MRESIVPGTSDDSEERARSLRIVRLVQAIRSSMFAFIVLSLIPLGFQAVAGSARPIGKAAWVLLFALWQVFAVFAFVVAGDG